MTNIRRRFRPGDVCFLTSVTYGRAPILVDNAELLWESLEKVQQKSSLEIIAWVILPDHFHVVIDPKSGNVSNLMKRFKLSFSRRYRCAHCPEFGRVWQYRFWDHIIRDQGDLNRHIDYIHYNPVKHGFVNCPMDYAHSSIQRYREAGYYALDWGVRDDPTRGADLGE